MWLQYIFSCLCRNFSKYVGLPRKKIIIRHPHSVHGSPIWLSLCVSRHDWPARPYYINLITGWGSQSPTTHNNEFYEWVKCWVCPLNKSERVQTKFEQSHCIILALCIILRSCIITINVIILIITTCCFVFIMYMITLTNWGRVTHICFSEQGYHCFRKWLVT